MRPLAQFSALYQGVPNEVFVLVRPPKGGSLYAFSTRFASQLTFLTPSAIVLLYALLFALFMNILLGHDLVAIS